MTERKTVLLKKLQSVIELLNFACPVHAFLRRFIDLTCGVRSPHCFVCLNNEARADIRAWLTFIEYFNGKAIFSPEIGNPQMFSLYTLMYRVQRDMQLFWVLNGLLTHGLRSCLATK